MALVGTGFVSGLRRVDILDNAPIIDFSKQRGGACGWIFLIRSHKSHPFKLVLREV
jgi:hypothetical protein